MWPTWPANLFRFDVSLAILGLRSKLTSKLFLNQSGSEENPVRTNIQEMLGPSCAVYLFGSLKKVCKETKRDNTTSVNEKGQARLKTSFLKLKKMCFRLATMSTDTVQQKTSRRAGPMLG